MLRYSGFVLTLLLSATASAQAQRGAAPYPLQLWKEPAFKKAFLREFGADTSIEPPLNDVEKQQMEKLSAAMGDQPAESLRALAGVTTETSTAEFDFILGQLSLQTNQPPEKAVAHFESALKKFPNFRRAHFALGRTLVQQGNYARALSALARAMELGRADANLFGLLGYCHLALENAGSAESAYRMALVLQPSSGDWKMGLLRALLVQSKADEAIAMCNEMLGADPKKNELWMLQSNAFLIKKDYLRAATNLELVARNGAIPAADFMRLGDIYVNEQLHDAALSAYSRAMTASPPIGLNDAIRIVETLAVRGGLEQSKDLLGSVRKSFATSLGDIDRRRLMKIDARVAVAEGAGGKFVQILEEVVQLDPLDGDALMQLAQHYASSGEKERAILYYQRAAAVEAFEADASVKLAQLFAGTGKIDQAIPLLKRAQQIKPRDGVAKYLEELERYQKRK